MKNKKIIVAAFVLVIGTVVSIPTFTPQVASAMVEDDDIEITGNLTAEIPKSMTPLTDEELIDLFNIKSEDGSDIRVFSEYIDYSKPGNYEVIFSSVNVSNPYGDGALYGFLNVTDYNSVINTETNTATVVEDTINVDYKELFGVEAREYTEGDLTDKVVVDDSEVDLTTPGIYPVTFSVTDSQGNVITKEVTLTVENGKPIMTGEYFIKVETNGKPFTDQQLIDLFNIKSSESTIVVDQSAVDYAVEGEYHISFSSTNSVGTTVFQTVLILE